MKKSMVTIIMVLVIVLCCVCGYFSWILSNSTKKTEIPVDPLLYEACDEDSCIYLLGTIHIGNDKLKGLTDKIWKAYNDSEAIAFEVDILTAVADEESAYLPEGDDLSNHLTEEQFTKLEDFLTKRFIPIDVVRKFNLASVSSLLELFVYQELECLSENGVDYQLLEKSHEDNKEIIELESVEFQENMLYSFPDEIYIDSIESILDDYEASKKNIELLYNSYLYGNVLVLRDLLSEDENSDDPIMKEYNDKMLFERNIGMAEKAETYLKENKKVMITVGAAHIIGNRGLIDLLREKGYKISLVK